MKYVLVSLIALFIFSFSAFSQDEGKIGVGASFGTNLVVSSSQSNPIIYNSMIYVPINMSGFRLEPFLMINTSSNKYQVEGQPNTYERSMTGITFGSGFFFLMRANKSVVPYLGLRVGYGTNSSKSKSQYSDSEDSQGSIFIGGFIGGEYYFSPAFSLGADAGISYYNFFTPTDKSGLTDMKYASYSNSQITTTAAIIARIFF